MLDYNPVDTNTLVNPFAVYDELRKNSPVFWSPTLSAWVLSRYNECKYVLKNHDLFARDLRRIGYQLPDDRDGIQFRDPPNQFELREALLSAISRIDFLTIAQQGAETLLALLKKHVKDGQFDFMGNIAAPIALKVTSELTGTRETDPDLTHKIFEALTKNMDQTLYSRVNEEALEAADTLELLMMEWVSSKPINGMLGEIIKILPKNDLHSAYVIYSLCAVYNACYSTIYAGTGTCAEIVLRNKSLFLDYFKNGGRIDTAVDEIIRFTSPAQLTGRHAVSDTYIGQEKISAKDSIIVLIAAANRDPDAFEYPNILQLDRRPNFHLSHGFGSHSCIGRQVARIWITHLLSALTMNDIPLELSGEPKFVPSATLRHLFSLPVISM